MRQRYKILIRAVNWIGDAVMTIPAISAIKKAFPDAEIDLLSNSNVKSIFTNSRFLDNFITLEAKNIFEMLKISVLLRSEHYSKAFLLQNAFGAAALAFLSDIPERIGYGSDLRGCLLTHNIAYKRQNKYIHHIDYYLNMLRDYGISADYTFPYIDLQLDEVVNAQQLLLSFRYPILAICPGAVYGSAKRWLPDRFAKVADDFIFKYQGSVIILGSANETHTAQTILSQVHYKSNVFDYTAKLSLRETIALISQCDCVLSNDSGLMHVAYATGVALVAIFGSTDPALTGPQGKTSKVIKSDVQCSPCFKRTCPKAEIVCMQNITAEMVIDAIVGLMPINKAVFFDRDGTLCKDAHYLNRWQDFEPLPHVEKLQSLKDLGYMLIGVTNQSGIARGRIKEEFVRDVNELFISRYGFDHFYYCPHLPDEKCFCRKPLPGMLFDAKIEYRIDLKKSFVVGDKDADMLLAKAVGAKGIFVATGQQIDSKYADFKANDLRDVLRIVSNA